MFVGGEFYDDSRWTVPSSVLNTNGLYFLNGGRASLTVITDYLLSIGITRILLPSYLCPSILDVLDQKGLGYSFYQVNSDFSIDLRNLEVQIKTMKAMYIINYFGFQHSPEILDFIRSKQQSGVFVIEDNCQSGFANKTVGDFVFNSMRKVCACDGAYVATRINLSTFIDKYQGRPNHRLPLIRDYRRLLPSYLFNGQGRREDLERLFYQAESLYESDGVVIGDPLERQKIEHMDWTAIRKIRRENYNRLLEGIFQLPALVPIYPSLQGDNMPLGLPVYLNEPDRDQLLETLADESISLTVQWDALLTDPRTNANPLTVGMANKIITLPVDQYTNSEQIKYLLSQLNRFFSK